MKKSEIRKYLAAIGKKGGLTRAQNLSKRQRAAIARMGGLAKAEKKKRKLRVRRDD
jgi:hypothetical protein